VHSGARRIEYREDDAPQHDRHQPPVSSLLKRHKCGLDLVESSPASPPASEERAKRLSCGVVFALRPNSYWQITPAHLGQAFPQVLPTLGGRQKAVYDCLAAHSEGMTNLEIAYSLRRAINTIKPRTNERVKLGVVREVGRRPCSKSGRMAIVWGVT
jgi:hypothetical protein